MLRFFSHQKRKYLALLLCAILLAAIALSVALCTAHVGVCPQSHWHTGGCRICDLLSRTLKNEPPVAPGLTAAVGVLLLLLRVTSALPHEHTVFSDRIFLRNGRLLN